MLSRLATVSDTSAVIEFFSQQLQDIEIDLAFREFTCQLGLRAAIRRKEVLVCVDQDCLIAAARFYRRKRDHRISLYQFAVDPNYRGLHLISHLLMLLDADVIAKCLKQANLNYFYQRNGWSLIDTDNRFNYWLFSVLKEKITE